MSKYILKLARCIQELERIKGVREGSFGKVRTTKCPSKTPQITQVDTTNCRTHKIPNDILSLGAMVVISIIASTTNCRPSKLNK